MDVKTLVGEYYASLPSGVLREFVEDPSSREWAYTFLKGRDIVFTRKRRLDEVSGFLELYHSTGKFKNPKSWEGLLGWDLVIDVDAELPEEPEAFLKSLGRLLKDVVIACDELRRALGFPRPDVVNFSGSKGFHVRYFDSTVRRWLRWDLHERRGIKPGEIIQRVGRGVVWLAREGFVAGDRVRALREGLLDDSMYDLKRLIRCVGSMNVKSLLPAVPVWSREGGRWVDFRDEVLGMNDLELGCLVAHRTLTWPGRGGLGVVLSRVLDLDTDADPEDPSDFVEVWGNVMSVLGELKP
ncbi:hypothetical protein [Methanopyrus kandleri]|uniref:DNA primase small subunit PriS n=1 Tax=Methanopyrus kandleri (strain AV19 / DSM 6324 / JCM 9639 / NBRC 100938) TaxID=190192 RepID=PRIS_METKA|nr:hypothetical protein [Methanopyrus kandleri]Q8TXS4.2 RecName: Full=DNA primase small subunit PriS [Methanopyrus kandleri AV19]